MTHALLALTLNLGQPPYAPPQFLPLTTSGYFTPLPGAALPPPIPVETLHAGPPVVALSPEVLPPCATCPVPTYVYPVPACGPLTMKEFFKCFKPVPGKHVATVLHPTCKKPVEVCFTLPDCCLKSFEVYRRTVEFDYIGGKEVTIRFRLLGKVDVSHRG